MKKDVRQRHEKSTRMKAMPWTGKIVNPAQLGGIETAVLDNGPGRGVRVAWVNTGTPLRYKVVLDRALDIAGAFYGAHSLAWLSHGGITAPKDNADRGLEWLRSFGGGLVTTCGLTHVGPPESDEHGKRGIHGRISNLPAMLESVVQPDPAAGQYEMSITGVVQQTCLFGPNLELRRTISSRLGEAGIRIRDTILNRGNTPVPHMLLYHCNLGWPLVDKGAEFFWKGRCRSRGRPMDDELFASGHDYHRCPGVLESHRGVREACGFIDVTPDKEGMCTAGVRNRKLGLALSLRFRKRQLPWLTNWQHWGAGEFVTGLEPGTHPPIGQAAARSQRSLLHIGPGKARKYELTIDVSRVSPRTPS